MVGFLVGVAAGAMVTALLGGPTATRASARLEAAWDRGATRGPGPGFEAMVGRLAADPALFTAYQRQYWTWAGIVGGGIIGLAVVGALAVWALTLAGWPTAGAAVAAATAVLTGAATMFWVRKLIQKRRVVRLVYHVMSR